MRSWLRENGEGLGCYKRWKTDPPVPLPMWVEEHVGPYVEITERSDRSAERGPKWKCVNCGKRW